MILFMSLSKMLSCRILVQDVLDYEKLMSLNYEDRYMNIPYRYLCIRPLNLLAHRLAMLQHACSQTRLSGWTVVTPGGALLNHAWPVCVKYVLCQIFLCWAELEIMKNIVVLLNVDGNVVDVASFKILFLCHVPKILILKSRQVQANYTPVEAMQSWFTITILCLSLFSCKCVVIHSGKVLVSVSSCLLRYDPGWPI